MVGNVTAGAVANLKTAVTAVAVIVLLAGCTTYPKKQSTMRWGKPGGPICLLPRGR
jgi:hypothetical protein